jgi:thymidylate kinase
MVLERIDAVVRERALLFGSLPPHGRDIDLLVTPGDAIAVTSRLRDEGFISSDGLWVLFAGCAVSAVEVVTPSAFALPGNELRALFAEGVPIGTLNSVVEPAPHHALLILSRRLARERGALAAKHRARIDRALASNPMAWETARERAELWDAQAALERLRMNYDEGEDGRRPGRRAARPRRTRAIAFSGIEGSGKSSQAKLLCSTLERLGHDAVVIETPLLKQPRSNANRRGLTLQTAFGGAYALWRPIQRHIGRGTILVYDGYALDLAVSLLSGPTVPRRAMAVALLRILSPRPLRAYLLDLTAEVAARQAAGATGTELAHQRNVYDVHATAFRTRRLGADRGHEELCEEIAADVWLALNRRTLLRSAARRLKRAATAARRRLQRRPH